MTAQIAPASTTTASAWLAASAVVHVLAALWLFREPTDSQSVDEPAKEYVLAGETFELPSPAGAGAAAPAEDETAGAPGETTVASTSATATTSAATTTPTRGRAARHARPASSGGAAPAALFGAVGDRSAMDLATAFTRSFPIAASGDPQWAHVPLGAAGAADVTFVLDDAGALRDIRVAEGGSAALTTGIRRTLALIRGRTFTARGASTHLRVRAVVSPDEKHDGLHGDVFAVGAGFHGREGTAFFALSIGRRIDVHVTERR